MAERTGPRPGPLPMSPEPVQATGRYYGELEGYIILGNEPLPPLARPPRPMGVLDRTGAPFVYSSDRETRPNAPGRGRAFHLPTLSTLNVSKIEKNEEESMLSPFHREQERRAKQLRRSYERDQERKEAARRGPSQVVRAAWGYDHTGRPYFSTRLPWVRYDPTTGEGVLDVETAAANGVAVYYDEARKEVVVR